MQTISIIQLYDKIIKYIFLDMLREIVDIHAVKILADGGKGPSTRNLTII